MPLIERLLCRYSKCWPTYLISNSKTDCYEKICYTINNLPAFSGRRTTAPWWTERNC